MNKILVCTDLVKCYQLGCESIYALNKVNLSIVSGEFVVLSGPSGSGKTTLLNVCGLLDSPKSGLVMVNGVGVDFSRKTDLTDIRREHFGYVFQNFNLLPVLTALENVEMALVNKGFTSKEIRKRSVEAIKLVGLSHRMNHKPCELSGGQQQRIAIARAIVHNPSVIFADEPTANLDSLSAVSILELLQNINRDSKTTVIISTHDSRVLDFATRKICMLDGQIVKGDIE